MTYRRRRTVVGKTQATHSAIGEWRKPRAQGQPGYVRVDTVHQGDHDGANRHPSRPSARRPPSNPTTSADVRAAVKRAVRDYPGIAGTKCQSAQKSSPFCRTQVSGFKMPESGDGFPLSRE